MEENMETQEGKENREIPGMFDGPVLPLIIRLAVPMLFGMLVQLIYNVTDALFISRIDMNDPSIVGGTGLIFPLFFFAIAIANGLMVGNSSLVARAVGAQKWDMLSKCAESGMVLAVLGGLVIFLPILFFAEPLVRAMGAEGDYAVNGLAYLQTISWIFVPMMIGQTLAGILQGEGKMQYVMTAMFIGTLGNIVLDPVFIFDRGVFLIGFFGMGIKGAALATVLSQSLAVFYLLIVFMMQKSTVRISWKISQIKSSIMWEILRIGVPQTVSQILLSMSFLIFNRIAMSVDPLSMTALSLTGRMDNAVMMPLFALGAALVTVVGQNSARGLWDRAREAWKKGLMAGSVSVLFSATIMVIFAPRIYPQFSDVGGVISYAVRQTRMLEYTFLAVCVSILAGSVFQGMGKPVPSLMIMAFRLFFFAIPLVLVLVRIFGLGVPGIWIGVGTSNILSAVICLFWVKSTMNKLEREGAVI